MSSQLTEQAAAFAAWRRDAREAADIQRAFMAGALAALTSTTPRDQLLRECIDFGRVIGSKAERAPG